MKYLDKLERLCIWVSQVCEIYQFPVTQTRVLFHAFINEDFERFTDCGGG